MSIAPAPICVIADELSTTETTISSNQPPTRVVRTGSGVGSAVGSAGATGSTGTAVGSTTTGSAGAGGSTTGAGVGWQAANTILAMITIPTNNIRVFRFILFSSLINLDRTI